jgi:hypothetical protein
VNFEVIKALCLDEKGISARLQIHKLEGSVLIGEGRMNTVVVQTLKPDGRTRHNGLRLVMHNADDTSKS